MCKKIRKFFGPTRAKIRSQLAKNNYEIHIPELQDDYWTCGYSSAMDKTKNTHHHSTLMKLSIRKLRKGENDWKNM